MARLRALEEYLNREFGELDINLQDPSERAEDIAAGVPQVRANEVLNQGVEGDIALPDFGGAAPEGDWDRTRLLGAGAIQTGEMALGAAEYAARQNKFLRPSVAPAIQSLRGSLAETREGILSGVSPDYLDAVGREMLTLDPDKTIWQGGPLEVADAIYGKFLQSLPSTLAVMLPAGRLFKVGNTRGALTYLGASEGGLSVGAIANNLTDEIAGMTNEELLQESQRYAEIYNAVGGDEELARQEFTAEAQGISPLLGGVGVASISLATGRLLKPVFDPTDGLGVGSRIGRGFMAEFPQEGSQGATEQFVQNYAARIYDEGRALSEGVAEAFVQEGTIGGLTGGAVAGTFGTRPQRPLPPPIEGPGGQMGIPGVGPAMPEGPAPAPTEDPLADPDLRTEDPAEVARRTGQLGLVGGLDLDPRSGRDLSESTDFELVPQEAGPAVEGQQGVLPMGDTRPLRERGPGQRTITEVDEQVPTQLPDSADIPSAEPIGDIEAQIADMFETGGRVAVYLSPEQRSVPRTLPKGARVLPNFDGKGGVVIAKNASAANRANNLRRQVAEGSLTMQEAIGQLTQSGKGKPVDGRYVVQKLDDRQNVARESMVSTRSEALKLQKKWGGNTRITTPEAAVQRREALQEAPLRTEDREEVAARMGDLEQVAETDAADQQAREEQARLREQRIADEGLETFDESITDEGIERLARYEVSYPVASERVLENKATEYQETRETQEFETRDEADAFAEQAEKKAQALAISYGRTASKSKVNVRGTEELDIQFERAVRAKADRKATTSPTGEVDPEGKAGPVKVVKGDKAAKEKVEAYNKRIAAKQTKRQTAATTKGEGTFQPDTQESFELSDTSTTIEKETRAQYGTTPGKKLKFIRRERGAQVRRKAEVRDVKDTPVVVKAKKGAPKQSQKVRTRALTYESVRAEESREQKAKRLANVKEANTRLRYARTRAKRFLNRFDTTGPFGTYVADWTNIDGSLTQEAIDFILARDTYFSLIELADTILATNVKSNAHARMAKSVAVALEKAKAGYKPAQFAKEFSAVANSTEYEFNKTVPKQYQESLSDKQSKILKENSERRRQIIRRSQMEALGNQPIYRDTVLPILRKFQDAVYEKLRTGREIVYTPTQFEMDQMRWALRNFRFESRYDQDIFYKPLKSELTQLGFRFDEAGDVDTASFETRTTAAKPTSKVELPGGIYEPTARQVDPVAIREKVDIVDRFNAVRDLRTANALIQKFKQMTASSKVTINGIKRQEQRLIRGLRKIGAWRETAPGMGIINVAGYRSKTYRLVGPRLDNRTMKKDAAKEQIQRIRTFPIPRELGATARASEAEQTVEVQEFVDENTLEFFLENTTPEQYDAEYVDAASAVVDSLEARGNISALDALTRILENAPVESFYYQLADKLSTLNLADVEVVYGDPSDFPNGEPGKFRARENLVLLNRDNLSEIQQRGDRIFGARVMHILTHEILHGATHQAIKADTGLRRYFEALQQRTREYVIENGIPRTQYGLKKGAPIDEFVVEAFSNPEFQALLKQVPSAPTSVWKKIIDFLRNFLDLTDVADTVFDAIMLTEDILFEGAGVAGAPGSGDFFIMDSVMDKFSSIVRNRVETSENIWERVKNRAKNVRFSPAAMNLMTMEQFRDSFDSFFNGLVAKYHDAFNRRNARSAELQKLPGDLSREWTQLQEGNPEVALEMSQLMSDATLQKESPTEKGSELHSRFKALPDDAQKLYVKVRNYYKQAVDTEQKYMLAAALRGVTDLDNQQVMKDIDNIKSKDDLLAYLKTHITEDEAVELGDHLWQLATVSQQFEGDYFPLMRYGNNVVYAERVADEEFFEDRKEAWGRRKEIQDGDATLDVEMKQNDDGRWVVRTIEREFVMSEDRKDIQEERARLVEEYGDDAVGDVQQKIEVLNDAAITSNAQLNAILGTVKDNPAATAAIKNFYLRTLSESSMRKHEIRRRNRRGVNRDLQHRNLAAYSKQASYYTAQLQYGWEMAEALSEMREFVKNRRAAPGEATTDDLSRVVNHLKKRDEMGTDLPDIHRLVRTGVEGTHFFMLTSPSYWAINYTQPWMVTLPTMAARHGYGDASAAMGQIMKLVTRPLYEQVKTTKGGLATWRKNKRGLTEDAFNVIEQVEAHIRANTDKQTGDEYVALLEELRRRHVIDINVFTELRERAAGKEASGWTRMVDASRIMAHLTEVNNRVLTALSAYQLERTKLLSEGMSEAEAVEGATKYAGDMVSQTQFNYSSENKPPLFQAGGPLGGVAPLMFQFMQWPQHMYAHLIRNYRGMVEAGVMNKSEARSALLGLLGTHAAVGGMVGMMLQPIKWAFGLTMMALGDDDEPYTLARALSGESFDHWFSSNTADLFGTRVSTVLSKGVPAGVLGVDLSARMSMGTFYFVDLRGDNPQSVLGSLVASFGGATLNQGIKFTRGLSMAMEGDVLRGVEMASPKMARDLLRAIRYSSEGLVNNAGDTVIDASEMSPYEILVQSIGFQPSEVSQFYSAQNTVKEAESYARDRRASLLESFRNAETAEERRRVRRDIMDYNRGRPAAEKITYSSMFSSIESQREREARFRRYGVNIDERKARFYERYSDPYQ